MAFDPVPTNLKGIWDSWNLRGVVILSLLLQALLIFFAPLRKRTGNLVITFLVWSAYLLADWAAAFAVGLISSRQDDGTGDDATRDLLVFWAPFLLVHLGGPDTITAFALEDNALWFRHFVGLIFQTGAAVYVFLLTLPKNELLVPTILMFVAGLIKYGERTRALYLGSMDKLKEFKLGKPTAGPDYEKFMEEYNSRIEARIPIRIREYASPKRSDLYPDMKPVEDDAGIAEQSELVNAYNFFCMFKGLVGDSTFSNNDREESLEFFKNKNAKDVLKVLSAELNFFYEMLFTKSQVVYSMWGHFRRFLCFCCAAASLVLFIRVKNKHIFHLFDVTVTYALIGGAMSLDTVALIMLVLSDWAAASLKIWMKKSTIAATLDWFLTPLLRLSLARKKQRWDPVPGTDYEVLATPVLFRRWSESICAYSFLEFCLKKRQPRIPKPEIISGHNISKILSFPYDVLVGSLGLLGQAFFCCDSIPILGKISEFFQVIFEWFLNKLGLMEIYLRARYLAKNPFMYKLWYLIVEQLKEKSSLAYDLQAAKRICEGRGDMVLNNMPEGEVSMLMPYIEEAEYDQSILLWHIATDICYHADEDSQGNQNKGNEDREFSKILSDYMLYLLVMQGNIMAGVAGDGQKQFQDSCAEAERFFRKSKTRKPKSLRDACERLIRVDTHIKPIIIKGDQSKSVLFDACSLAKKLRSKEDKWTIMNKVWIEMLCYAASHCRSDSHVQTLSKGGELVTFVWLLMVHLGLGEQFQSTKGHGRVKLVVSS